jgi:hypothetical protein
VATVGDFDSEGLVVALIKCFERISAMLNEQDNFIDMKFIKQQNLKEATHKFKVCQKMTEYFKVTIIISINTNRLLDTIMT